MESSNMRNRGMIALRGAAALTFGVAALAWPAPTLTILIALLGIFFLLDGFFSGLAAIYFAEWRVASWPLAIEALVALGIGLITLFWPGVTAYALVYLLAAWAILVGAIQLIAAYQLRHFLQREWLLALRGPFPLLLGALLIAFPQDGALALIRLVGLGVGLNGLYLLALAYQLYRLHGRTTAI